MNGITELAKLFKDRENETGYSPVFGTIIELPSTKIRLSEKVILTAEHISTIFNLHEQDAYGNYILLGKTILLLPYADNQKYIAIGVIR